jgi:predicted pyridoxine 5'-phosphate oxidase superfamily flavin-nucleotide-binding protein
MKKSEPFHEGEIAVQERTGERPQGARNGAMLHDFVTPPACRFLQQQRVLAVAVPDDAGRPWASLWLGEPGFVRCADERSLRIATSPTPWGAPDPTATMLAEGRRCGLLSIDLVSRRRLRINGSVSGVSGDGVAIAVEESFANCPKYIQQRELGVNAGVKAGVASASPAARGTALGDEQRRHVERADTAFVASLHPERGLDASHRGGEPGFVRVVGPQTLRFPDYPGNSMFQTLGNFEADPRAGVVVVDFERSLLLSLSGLVSTFYGEDDPAHPSGGTGRYWQLDVAEWVQFPLASPFDARLLGRSPFNPPAFADPLD